MLIYDIIPPEKIKKVTREILGFKEYKSNIHKAFGIGWRLGVILFLIIFITAGFAPIKFSWGVLTNSLGGGDNIKTVNFYPTVSYSDLKELSSLEEDVHNIGWQNIENVLGIPDVNPLADISYFSKENSAIYQAGLSSLTVEQFIREAEEELINEVSEETDKDIGGIEDVKIGDAQEEGKDNMGNEENENDKADETGKTDEVSEEIGKEDETNEIGEVEEVDSEIEENETHNIDELKEVDEKDEDKDGEEKIGLLGRIRNFLNSTVVAQEKLFSAKINLSLAIEEREGIKKDEDIESPEFEEIIIIKWSLNGKDWYILDTLYNYSLSSTLNSPTSSEQVSNYLEYETPFLKSFENVENLRIKFEGMIEIEPGITVYLDSVWLEVKYQEEEIAEELILETPIKDWKVGENPEFTIKKTGGKQQTGLVANISSVFEQKPKLKKVIIRLPKGKELHLKENNQISVEQSSPINIKLTDTKSLKPGKHTLKAEIEWKGKTHVLEQDFTWGVLAINFNKSIYTTEDEQSYIQMGVLDDQGHTICDADLELRIKNQELGIDEYFSTDPSASSGQAIQYSGQCAGNFYVEVPDYFAYYELPGKIGIYELELTAHTTNGTRTITDSFEIRESTPFDVERIGPTRIYPPADYEVKLIIKANQSFKGEIIETVPNSFAVNDQFSIFNFQSISNDSIFKKLIWEAELEVGETYELSYTFNAPNISPYIYMLGPLRFSNKGQETSFQEARQWQIAADQDNCPSGWTELADGRCRIFITNTSQTTFNIPSDWDNSSNTVEVIAGGGGGRTGLSGTPGAGGGGGASGAYAMISNFNSGSATSVAIQIGVAGSGGASPQAGGDTWFNSTGTVMVKGGGPAINSTGGIAPGTENSEGNTVYAGRDGGDGGSLSGNAGGGGGGGGGASGPNGQGTIGSPGGTSDGGTGGSGGPEGGGSGGSGGAATAVGNPGTSGTEWQSSPNYGSGGAGGGGGGGGRRNQSGASGGTSGAYGAGGAGGGGAGGGTASPGTGTAGTQGIIVITYSPLEILELPGPPGTPTYTNISTSTLTVNWTAPSEGGSPDYYRIERAVDDGFGNPDIFEQIATTTNFSYNDSGLSSDTTYWYRVRAVNESGDGDYSNHSDVTTQKELPGHPGTPTYTNVSTSTLTVNWTAPSEGGSPDYYRIERAVDDGFGNPDIFEQIATTTNFSYNDSGLIQGTIYWYRVRATNETGDGNYSGNSNIKTLPGIPGTPTYSNVATSTLTVNWTASTGGNPDYYKIERSEDEEGSPVNFIEIATTSELFYNDSGLLPGLTYWYRVRATNETGDGDYSIYSSITTDSEPISSIIISGFVFESDRTTTSSQGLIIHLAINGVSLATTTASALTAEYSFELKEEDIPELASSITVFIDSGTESGAVVTKYQGFGNIETLDIYDRYIVLRHEDSTSINNQDIFHFDSEKNKNVPFRVYNGPAYVLEIEENHTLLVFPEKTYQPGWNVFTPYLVVDGIFNPEDTTITIEGFNNPFVVNGTFQFASSTLIFQGVGTTTIPAIGYYNLQASLQSGTAIYILDSGTITVNNNLSLLNGGGNVLLDANENNTTVNVANNFIIENNQVFSASDFLTVGGDFTNQGEFIHNSGKVEFSGTFRQTISGNLTGDSSFNDLVFTNSSGADEPFEPGIILTATTTVATSTIVTGSVRVQFQAGATFYFNKINWNGQSTDSRIFLRSSNPGERWFLHINSNPVYYINVQDSDASASPSSVDATDPSNVNAGNNQNWDFGDDYLPQSQNWRWYMDEQNETPQYPLADQNQTPSYLLPEKTVKLRLTIREMAGADGENIKMRIQYSTSSDFSESVSFLPERGDCGIDDAWCYGDGVDEDNDLITTLLLSDSAAAATHNESGVSTSSYFHASSTAAEWEFTVKNNGAEEGVVYYFRAYDNTNSQTVVFREGYSYPSIVPGSAELSFVVQGLPSGTSTRGVTTNINTTPNSVFFGNLPFGQSRIGAHRFNVSTNASKGYQIFVFERNQLMSATEDIIVPVAGTNETPTAWSVNGVSAYGYHAGDDTLSDIGEGPSRFAAYDSYARFETNPKEIGYHPFPTTEQIFDFIFRVEVTEMQPVGNHISEIVYIAIPTF